MCMRAYIKKCKVITRLVINCTVKQSVKGFNLKKYNGVNKSTKIFFKTMCADKKSCTKTLLLSRYAQTFFQ